MKANRIAVYFECAVVATEMALLLPAFISGNY